ncbi:unnamed protein product [Taenia asiatica]|uniref:BPL/LPL catalytic domain-containing protein n=1 Tax=Taenia asiatica TaxID=60517 RepID=A0A0R3VVK8_TAEAS|nr:unnamed protein product [Taenia asiatica]
MPDVVVATVGAGEVDVTKYQGVCVISVVACFEIYFLSDARNQQTIQSVGMKIFYLIEHGMICREEFVALHSENILENLSDYLREKFEYSQAELEKLPEKKRDEAVNFNNLLKQFPRRGKFNVLVFPVLE